MITHGDQIALLIEDDDLEIHAAVLDRFGAHAREEPFCAGFGEGFFDVEIEEDGGVLDGGGVSLVSYLFVS